MPALTDQSIVLYRGEAVTINFTMAPVEDISTWALQFTVTKTPNKVEKMLGPLPMGIVSGVLGTFQIALTEEQLDIKPGSYRFDVWRTDEGTEQVKAIGVFLILGNSRLPEV